MLRGFLISGRVISAMHSLGFPGLTGKNRRESFAVLPRRSSEFFRGGSASISCQEFHVNSSAIKKLTRRANHRHIVIVATIEPAPGNRSRAFSIAILNPFFESDGGRIRDAASPMSAPCRKTRLQARRRPNQCWRSAGPLCHFAPARPATTKEFNMTAYLISLALAGLLALALWEAMS
jgi:hypothetical protein